MYFFIIRGSHYIAQVTVELILSPQSPEGWDCRCALLCLIKSIVLRKVEQTEQKANLLALGEVREKGWETGHYKHNFLIVPLN
jgi:hypothetical protein